MPIAPLHQGWKTKGEWYRQIKTSAPLQKEVKKPIIWTALFRTLAKDLMWTLKTWYHFWLCGIDNDFDHEIWREKLRCVGLMRTLFLMRRLWVACSKAYNYEWTPQKISVAMALHYVLNIGVWIIVGSIIGRAYVIFYFDLFIIIASQLQFWTKLIDKVVLPN